MGPGACQAKNAGARRRAGKVRRQGLGKRHYRRGEGRGDSRASLSKLGRGHRGASGGSATCCAERLRTCEKMGCHAERSEGSLQFRLAPTTYEQLQGCFAALSMTDLRFFTPSVPFRRCTPTNQPPLGRRKALPSGGPEEEEKKRVGAEGQSPSAQRGGRAARRPPMTAT
jgi:hypothetical protein